ncbi:MAG TPA: DUF2851 family protein [Salinivirgaceae bacterium]|nr:DUF2851 family protein [Salinivirgaceae bacterium]
MDEKLLQHIWQYGLYDRQEMKTVDGQDIQVASPGMQNSDSGPDFIDARIKIGETIWAGCVEVHCKSSDWNSHKHSEDPAYNNVILHVVYENNDDIITQSGYKVPTFEMKFHPKISSNYRELYESRRWVPCESSFSSVETLFLNIWIETLSVERMERKYNDILSILEDTKNDFNELFYRLLCKNLGFKVNAMPFERLAQSLPLSIVQKISDNMVSLEALLFGQAGFLKSNENETDDYKALLIKEYEFLKHKYTLKPLNYSEWKFFRIRPTNFPTVRIAQLAALLNKSTDFIGLLIDTEDVREILKYFKQPVSEYWQNHYNFGKPAKRKISEIGDQSIEVIIINTVSPFLFAYGMFNGVEYLKTKSIEWLEQMLPENNSIIEKWRELGGEITNARQSQAYLELKNSYCDKKRCLECRIGCRIVAEV